MAPVAAHWTVPEAINEIVRLGLANPGHAARTTAGYDPDRPILDGHESLAEALTGLLEELGVGFQVGTDDDLTPGDEAESYGGLLQDAARCTGGLITITDVELGQHDEFGDCLLFRCNGRPCSWPVELRGEYYDLMTFFENIDDLNAPPRMWHSVDVDESDGCDPNDLDLRSFYFFGDPDALRRLAADFGVELIRYG